MREIAFAQENNYAYYYMGWCLLQHGIGQAINISHRILHSQLRQDALQGQFQTPIHPW